MRRIGTIALLFLTARPSGYAAQEAGKSEARGRQSVSIESENDWWGKWSDKYYTNGMRASWTCPDFFTEDPGDATTRRLFFSVCQEMNTPRDTGAANPSPEDHPYSGLAYLSAGYGLDGGSSLWAAELRAGLMGPGALAKQTQRMWHDAIDESVPKGWDTQHRAEFALNLLLEHRRRTVLSDGTCDIVHRACAAIGNMRTGLSAGVRLRAGSGLVADYDSAPMRQFSAYSAPVSREKFACYAYFDLQAEAVAFNYALDGALFAESRSVNSKPWVAQASLGVAADWAGLRLTLFQSLRTEEFRGQDRAFAFGGGSASLSF